MGFAETGVGAGQILGVSLVPLLYAAVGLASAFLSLPLAALMLAIAVAVGLPPTSQDRRRAAGGVRALAADGQFWLLLVGFAFVGMLGQVSVLSWIPTYLRQVHGFTVVEAGTSTALVVAGLMVCSPIFGMLSDRLTARRPVMLAGCVLALVGSLVLLTTGHAWVAIGAALLISASMAATIPMQAVFASERFAAVGAGTAVGLINSGGQLAASLGIPLYGLLLDHGLGFGAVWGLATALGAVRVVVVLLLREPSSTAPRHR